MTETPDTTTEPDPTEPAADTTTPDKDTGPTEARKYRKRAQEAEAERDALRDRLTGMQRTEVERIAGQRLAAGADIWHNDNTLDTLLDDNGNVDPDKITARVKDILTERPHWQKPTTAAETASTVKADDRIIDRNQPTFADAFKPKNQR